MNWFENLLAPRQAIVYLKIAHLDSVLKKRTNYYFTVILTHLFNFTQTIPNLMFPDTCKNITASISLLEYSFLLSIHKRDIRALI